MSETKNKLLDELVEMGFAEEKAKRALSIHPNDLESAVEFLAEEAEAEVEAEQGEDLAKESESATTKKAKSWICTDTGKTFRTFRDAQLYAEKTGNSNFEEREEEIAPLSESEKKEKLDNLKKLAEERRKQREEKDKIDNLTREISRRKDGKEKAEIREKMREQKRKYEIELSKKEKMAEIAERQRLREEIAKDKGNAAAEKASREGRDPSAAFKEAYDNYLSKQIKTMVEKTPHEKVLQIISAIGVLDSRVQIMKTIAKLLSNIIKQPSNEKFRSINLDNKAFHERVGKYKSGITLLKFVGFSINERKLEISQDQINIEFLQKTVEALNKAI